MTDEPTAPSAPQTPGGPSIPTGGGGCLGCLGLVVLLALGLWLFNSIQGCTQERPPTVSSAPGASQPSIVVPPQDGTDTRVPTITRAVLFGHGVNDVLNAYDLGDHTTKLTICRDTSKVLRDMSSDEMQEGLDAMEFYDASVLQDLVRECNAMVG